MSVISRNSESQLKSHCRNTYVMRDQAHNTVQNIMREKRTDALITHPSWLALGLLLVAVNIVTVTAP